MSEDCTAQLGPNTKLRGKLVKLKGSSKSVHAFLGIPYAQPPVGKHRFKHPLAFPLWTGTRDAQSFGPICPQENGPLMELMMGDFQFPETNEDCLYLNVWTPTLDQDAKLPVMVWIHGGGFINGCSNYHNGIALADRQEVVFISINYRLGLFGFLCLGEDLAPGNMGLLDQVEALRWINSNIKSFGGDPDNITFFGESAGGISIGLHTTSNLSEGLFHKAICQSGPLLHPMWLQSPETAKTKVMARFKALGFEGSSSEDVMRWLEDKHPVWIAKYLDGGFSPVLDGYFVHELPQVLYRKEAFYKVPLILGFNSHEGAAFAELSPNKGKVTSVAEAKMQTKYAVTTMFYGENKNAEKVFEAIWDFYFGDETDLEKISRQLAEYVGDLMFVAPSIMKADIHSEHITTYLYNYGHRRSNSTHPEWVGATHMAEIDMVLGKPFYDEQQGDWTDEERKLSDLIMSYWANFARTGNPNHDSLPEWPKYDKDTKPLMYLDANPQIRVDHNPKIMKFWNVTIQNLLADN